MRSILLSKFDNCLSISRPFSTANIKMKRCEMKNIVSFYFRLVHTALGLITLFVNVTDTFHTIYILQFNSYAAERPTNRYRIANQSTSGLTGGFSHTRAFHFQSVFGFELRLRQLFSLLSSNAIFPVFIFFFFFFKFTVSLQFKRSFTLV